MDHGVQPLVALLGARELGEVGLGTRPVFLRQRAEDALRQQEKVAHMHAGGLGAMHDVVELRTLHVVGRDNQLPAGTMAHPVFGAVFVEQVAE